MSIYKTTKSKLKFLDEKKSHFRQHEFSAGSPVGTGWNAGAHKSSFSKESTAVLPVFKDDQKTNREFRSVKCFGMVSINKPHQGLAKSLSKKSEGKKAQKAGEII